MAITFKAEIRKNEQRKDGTWNVKIRVTKDGKVERISTHYYVDKSQIARKSFEIIDKEILGVCDEIIDFFRQTVVKMGMKVNVYDAAYLAKYLKAERDKYNPDKQSDFIGFAESHEKKLREEKRDGYADSIKYTLSWLKKGYKTLYIRDITTYELEKMQLSMLKTMKQTSANIHLRNIRTLYNAYIDAHNEDDLILHYPFRRFKFRKDDAPKKRVLNVDDIRKIIFFPDHKLERVNLARDVFFLSFALLGINSKDLYTCSEFDGQRIIYFRQKTKRKGEKAKTAPLVPDEIRPVFDKYRDPLGQRVFDFYKRYSTTTNFYRAINKGLKIICDEANIPQDITTYFARHSFATIARNDCGVSKDDVAVCLTHSSGLDVTDRYIHEDWGVLDRTQRKVLDFVFKEQ